MKRILLCLAALGILQAQAQRTQVWDFGAEAFDNTQYQNMLSVDEINSWYDTSITPGTAGHNILAFTASDSVNLRYNTNGAANHRLRTTNTNITRYDAKSLKDAAGNIYTGYIYSNSSNQPLVYLEQRYEAGDKVSFYVGSNSSAETYRLTAPSGATQEARYTLSAKIEKMTFYIGEDGLHQFCGVDEKLVVARIERVPAQKGTLSGSISSTDALPEGYGIAFTNTLTHTVYNATLSGNAYQAVMPMGYTYVASLTNANGFIINNGDSVVFSTEGQTKDISVENVQTCTINGSITGLPAEVVALLTIDAEKPAGKIFEASITIDAANSTYTGVFEKGVEYALTANGVNDYQLNTTSITGTDGTTVDIVFTQKAVWDVTIAATLQGEDEIAASLSNDSLKQVQFVFSNLKEEGYTYTFTGTEAIALRDGVYSVVCQNIPAGMKQMLTSNLQVNGAALTKQIDFKKDITLPSVAYRSTLNVGKTQEFQTINKALAYARRMTRGNDDVVTILIEPGNYEEMLRIDIHDIVLKNASLTPSIELANGGVDIHENAVRITGYYGWGYNYYSMGADYFYDERTLQVNKENGYASVVNPAQGTTLWNSTVVVTAKNFRAENIIFENSYNQYISSREANDVVVESSGSKGVRPTTVGSTAVQERKYRERACALGFSKTADRAMLVNCRVISRQDALYGDEGCRVAIEGGILNGACDYIFGGMTLVAHNTRLDMLVTSDQNDVAYLTASKTSAGNRGYLFYECSVGSAKPVQDMVETDSAKAGFLGRPWAGTAETVFYKTTIGKTSNGSSLIQAAGWNNGLVSTGSSRSYEYGTIEQSGVDNSSSRASWATVLTAPTLPDGTEITLYNFTKGNDNWDPFGESTSAVGQAVDNSSFQVTQTAQGTLLITPMEGDTAVRIYTLEGTEVYSQTLRDTNEVACHIPAGVYVVVAQNNQKQYVQKTLCR